MRKPITTFIRVRLDAPPELPLEVLDRVVHLAPTVTGQCYALVGVASSDIDVVISQDAYDPRDPRDELVAELAEKTGKYDGSVRDRLLIRRLPGHQTRDLQTGTVELVDYDGQADLVITKEDGTATRRTYRRWTHELTDSPHAGSIVRWHWRRYYPFLPEAEITTLADGFGERAAGLTLAAANRLASRELYSMARAAGWRKLTLREQTALGLEGQWHRDEVVAQRRADQAHRSGCGERTLLAASMASHIADWMDR